MLFQVEMTVKLPPDMPAEQAAKIKATETRRIDEAFARLGQQSAALPLHGDPRQAAVPSPLFSARRRQLIIDRTRQFFL